MKKIELNYLDPNEQELKNKINEIIDAMNKAEMICGTMIVKSDHLNPVSEGNPCTECLKPCVYASRKDCPKHGGKGKVEEKELNFSSNPNVKWNGKPEQYIGG